MIIFIVNIFRLYKIRYDKETLSYEKFRRCIVIEFIKRSEYYRKRDVFIKLVNPQLNIFSREHEFVKLLNKARC